VEIAPALSELRRVIGVGTSVEGSGARVTVLSLEDYADGFVVRGRLRLPAGAIRTDGPLVPSLSWDVRDDAGRMFIGRHRSSEVTGRDQEFAYAFTPALSAQSQSLTIELTRIGFRTIPFPGGRAFAPSEFELSGDWRLVVDLGALGAIR
jgi:hypothetical protein